MKKSDTFSFWRFRHLLNLELFSSRKAILIALVITFGLLKISFMLTALFGNSLTFGAHATNFTFFLLAGGFIFSSMAFHELTNPGRKYRYLTLPASNFEKFLSMWTLTCPGWIVAFMLTYLMYSWLAGSVGSIFFHGMTFIPFDIASGYVLTAIGYYVVFQGIFLAGAVHFRNYAFAKTIFTFLILCFICGFIFYLTLSDVIRSDFDWNSANNPFEDQALKRFITLAHHLVLWVLPPLSWFITFTGLKEQEA